MEGGGGGGLVCSFKKIFVCLFGFVFFYGKSVMPMFCNAMLLLLYVHVCVTRTGWKTRPRPKTVILLIKQSINQSINQSDSSDHPPRCTFKNKLAPPLSVKHAKV